MSEPEPPLFAVAIRMTPNIVLSSRGGMMLGTFRNGSIITFAGGDHGEHHVLYEGPEDSLRAVTHFAGYCRNSAAKPIYDGWCLMAVAKQLSVHILADRIHGLL